MRELYLEGKPDAQQSMLRWTAWWEREIVDRPPVTLRVRADRPWTLPSKQYENIRDRWLDVEFRVELHAAIVAQSVYFADTFPILVPDLGPEVMACLFGAEIEYSDNSGWSIPCFDSCREILGKKPDWQNPIWQSVERMIRLSAEAGKGKWLTGFTDMHTNGDLLAALRDPEELCLECIDDPAGVGLACDYVTPICLEAYNRQIALMDRKNLPMATWTPAPSWNRMFVPNCDFNALISIEMFDELVMPSLYAEVAAMDDTVFHLDGPTALQHLDIVLEIPGLSALQWVYGAGNEPASKWIDVYKKALAAGKGVQVLCVDIDDARRVMSELGAKGVWLDIGGAYDLDVAEGFLKEVVDWTCRTA